MVKDYDSRGERVKTEKILKALGIIELAICIAIIAMVAFKVFTAKAFSETAKRATITEGWMTTENSEDDFEATEAP